MNEDVSTNDGMSEQSSSRILAPPEEYSAPVIPVFSQQTFPQQRNSFRPLSCTVLKDFEYPDKSILNVRISQDGKHFAFCNFSFYFQELNI